MKKGMPIALAVIAVLGLGWTSWSTPFTGSAFELGASARALGLGGAFAALVDDETAVIHNPAALGTLTNVGFSSLYVRQFGGVTYGSVSLAMPWAGLNLSLLDSGLIPSTGGAFRYASQAMTVSGGVPIGSVALGARWRYMNVSSPTDGHGWTLDPAVLIELGEIRAAAMLESALSAPMTYGSGAEEPFEPSLRLGVAATLTPSPGIIWSAAFEASGLFGAQVTFGVGLEAWIDGLGARVGFDGRGATFGLTARFEGLQVDWAYAMRADLGNSHRISLTFRM